MLRHKIFAIGVILLTFPTMAQALEVFGNDPGRDGGVGAAHTYASITGQAIPFTPGTSTAFDRLVTSAWVLVGGNSSSVTMNVRIFADANTNGGPTGTALASGSTVLAASGSGSWVNVAFSTPVLLQDSANYYIAVEASSGVGFSWYSPGAETTYSDLLSGSNYSITGSEATAPVFFTSGGSWSDLGETVSQRPMGFQIVPEPSSLALSGISTLALTMAARRRKMRFRRDSTKPDSDSNIG
ncbi:PEP-CTERM sorting domain-containing protein [bacterium]|nr:PEP-CTERM sorting domain-containing protein [bacterium]